ncbi:MAG: hypothetical protein AABY22_14900 [Nanoarchaeota archaeon]
MKVKYSEVRVGQKFTYNGKDYIRHPHNRGLQMCDGKQYFTNFPKHRIVECETSYENE